MTVTHEAEPREQSDLVECEGPGCIRHVKAYLRYCCVPCTNRATGQYKGEMHSALCNKENA